ncbi:hypothetical protein GN956_G2414 [Arapaima gigas]
MLPALNCYTICCSDVPPTTCVLLLPPSDPLTADTTCCLLTDSTSSVLPVKPVGTKVDKRRSSAKMISLILLYSKNTLGCGHNPVSLTPLCK